VQYHTPSCDQVKVTVPYNVEGLMKFCTDYLQFFNPTLKVEITDYEDQESYNAAYNFLEHKVLINPPEIFNSMVDSFYNSGVDLKTTVELILAHELGHASAGGRAVYSDDHWECSKGMNKFLDYIRPLRITSPGSSLSSMSNERLEQFDAAFSQAMDLYEYLKKVEINAEVAAWQHGRQFVPTEHLSLYDEDNVQVLKGYMAEIEIAIKKLYYPLAHVRKVLLLRKELQHEA
jgi:hypothetical protein